MDFADIFKKNQKYQSGIKWLVGSGIITVLGASGWLFYMQNFHQSSQAVPVSLVTVKKEDIEITINESGTVELGDQKSLKSPGEVTVDKVLVKVGDLVQTNQQLLVLRNLKEQAQLANQSLGIRKQELMVARAREKVLEAQNRVLMLQKEVEMPLKQKLEIQKLQVELARSRAKVSEAQAELTAEQKELKNLQVFSNQGVIARTKLREQEALVRKAAAELNDMKSEVNAKQIEIKALTVEKQRQIEPKDKLSLAQSQLNEAESEVKTAQRELQRLQVERQNIATQIQKNFVTAPISGKILDIKVQDGDGINPGDILLTLGNPAQELVKLQLGTLDAAKVKINQLARLKSIGPNPQKYTGRVQTLHPIATSSREDENGSSKGNSSSQATVPAIVKLDKPTGTLIPGSQVSVEIVVQERQDVVAVSLEAIQRSDDGEPFVWVRDRNGKAQKQKVSLGLESATEVEVKSGLKAGDKIIIPSPKQSLSPGTSVIEAPP